MRRRLPDERLGDVLGILESWTDDDQLSIRTRSGEIVVVALAAVVAGKRVPPRRPSRAEVLALEAVAADGWPGLEQQRLGGWLLRAGGGFTGRANSALPLGAPGLTLAAATDAVETWYEARGLRPQLQVPLPACGELDRFLAARGYEGYNDTNVLVGSIETLTRSLPTHGGPGFPAVQVEAAPDDAWLSLYHYRGGSLPAIGREVIEAANGLLGFASVRTEGEVLAVVRGALAHGWLGVTALEVAAPMRRRGLGLHVLHGLAAWAAGLGATRVYLQVPARNEAALAFYERVGMAHHHSYRYRRAALTE